MSNSKDSSQKYSIAAYAWLMFITNYYRRVSELDLNFDEMMIYKVAHAFEQAGDWEKM